MKRSRFLSTLLMVALVVTLVPVGPALGALMEDSSNVAAAGTSVSAAVHGARVDIEVSGQNGIAYDVYRAGSALVEGVKLNDEPVNGKHYTDKTAQAGESYCYVVKSGSEVVGTVLVDVPAAQVRAARADDEASSAKAAGEPLAEPLAESLVSADDVSGMTTIENTETGVSTITVNTVWSPAGGPYFIRNDVVVPAGKTLTILPGTKVYFDSTASGSDAGNHPQTDAQSVTDYIDLVVHGKLVANGSSSSPIVMTGIYSLAESATADAELPQSYSWGSIFFDNKTAASSVSYCQIEFGQQAVWSYKTSYPAVKNCVMRNMYSGGQYPYAAVAFIAPPIQSATVPRVTVTGNSMFLPDSTSEGVAVYAESYGSGADCIADPYIANNNITAGYPIDLEGYEDSGDTHGSLRIKGTVTGNTLKSHAYNAAYIWAETTSKTVEFSTAFSNNVMKSDGSAAFDVTLSGDDSATVLARPTFTGDKITSTNNDCVQFDIDLGEAEVLGAAKAQCTPKFTSCDIRTGGGDCVEFDIDTGENVAAIGEPVFVGGMLMTTSECGVDVDTYCLGNGGASSSPSFTNVTGRALSSSSEVVYCNSYDGGTGVAKSNPKWIGGSAYSTYDDAMYIYSESLVGKAECNYRVESATVRGGDYGIYATAYGTYDASGTGGAYVSPTLLNSSIYSESYSSLYCYAYDNADGSAAASPIIKNCTVESTEEYGLDAEAYAYGYGRVDCSPVISDSSILSYDEAAYVYAYRSSADTKSAGVTCSPQITRSTMTGTYYEALDIDAENDGVGNCTVKPVIISSKLTAPSYDGGYEAVYIDASAADGVCDVSPTASFSTFFGDGGAWDSNAYSEGTGAGSANNSGTFTNCTFKSIDDDAFYVYSDTDTGTVTASPKFTSCTFESMGYDYYGAYIEAFSDATSVKNCIAEPVFNGGKIATSGEGLKVHSRAYATGNTATSTCGPKLYNFPVYSAYTEYALSLLANSEGDGHVYNNSYIYNSPVLSGDGGIQLHANAGNGAADCYNNAKVLGISSTKRMKVDAADANGIRTLAVTGKGNAYNNSEVRNVEVNASGHGLFTRAYVKSSETSNTVAVNKAIVSGNVFRNTWATCSSDGPDGIHMTCTNYGVDSTATCMPTISGNSIIAATEDGIEVSACSSNGICKPTISGNSIFGVSDYGIYCWDGSDSTMTAPVISKNTIVRTGMSGIYVDGAGGNITQNKVLQPGVYGDRNSSYDTCCLYWVGAYPQYAMVKGNMLVGSPSTGICFSDGAATVNYNSFADAAGNANRPFNYWTDQSAVASTGAGDDYDTPFDAKYNWWGVGTVDVSRTVNVPNYSGAKTDIVDYGKALPTRQPKVTKIVAAKSGTKVKLTVTFDRPMDKAVTKLYFGKASPYKTYNATGTWNTAGTVWTATRPLAGLPTGVKLYFSGARDLPGNTMISTSKYFKL